MQTLESSNPRTLESSSVKNPWQKKNLDRMNRINLIKKNNVNHVDPVKKNLFKSVLIRGKKKKKLFSVVKMV